MKRVMKLIRKISGSAVLIVLGLSSAYQVFAQQYVVSENVPAHIREAVESNNRSAEDTARDVNRFPAELLTLADLNVGDRVIELSALGQYYSTIMVDAVGPYGNVYMYDLVAFEGFGAEGGNAFAAANANAQYHLANYDTADYPSGVDAAYLILGYHDLEARDNDPSAMNANLFASLKPGGKFVVVDHSAESGSGWRDAANLHRIGKEVVIDEVTAAGFELISDSSLLSRPEDDRTASTFSMNGTTDRFVLVFQKPY